MQSAPTRPTARASRLSAEQYSGLRTDLERELRRLLPEGQEGDDRGLRDLDPRARRRALQIFDVLRRMNTEAFGVCVGCRSAIGYERLSVIPETTVCARCSRERGL